MDVFPIITFIEFKLISTQELFGDYFQKKRS